MSMISNQIDSLRTAAQTCRMLGRYEMEQTLLDAADTIWQLRDDLQRANAENAKLRELLKYNGAVIEACTSEILDHIGVPYIVGPAGVAQALMEATAMLVHKRCDFDPPSFYKEDK